jgi:hypothetical protein
VTFGLLSSRLFADIHRLVRLGLPFEISRVEASDIVIEAPRSSTEIIYGVEAVDAFEGEGKGLAFGDRMY